MMKWLPHLLLILFIGYVVGYYYRGLGNATVGKLMASSGS
jgi:hypothetical protein